jgi:hypothetical protein
LAITIITVSIKGRKCSIFFIVTQYFRSRKLILPAVGVRCADQETPFYILKLALTSTTRGGRTVLIVRLRTKSHGDCLFFYFLYFEEAVRGWNPSQEVLWQHATHRIPFCVLIFVNPVTGKLFRPSRDVRCGADPFYECSRMNGLGTPGLFAKSLGGLLGLNETTAVRTSDDESCCLNPIGCSTGSHESGLHRRVFSRGRWISLSNTGPERLKGNLRIQKAILSRQMGKVCRSITRSVEVQW